MPSQVAGKRESVMGVVMQRKTVQLVDGNPLSTACTRDAGETTRDARETFSFPKSS